MINKKKILKVLKQLKKIFPSNDIFINISYSIYDNELVEIIQLYGIQNRTVKFNSIYELEIDLENTVYGYTRCCVPTEKELFNFLLTIPSKMTRVKLARNSGLKTCDGLIEAKHWVDQNF